MTDSYRPNLVNRAFEYPFLQNFPILALDLLLSCKLPQATKHYCVFLSFISIRGSEIYGSFRQIPRYIPLCYHFLLSGTMVHLQLPDLVQI